MLLITPSIVLQTKNRTEPKNLSKIESWKANNVEREYIVNQNNVDELLGSQSFGLIAALSQKDNKVHVALPAFNAI